MDQRQKEQYQFFKEFTTDNAEILGISLDEDFFHDNINFKEVNRYEDNKYYVEFEGKVKSKPLYKADPTDFDRYLDIVKGCHPVESYGGEGKGDEYYTTYYFPNQDFYVTFDGYYRSYDGATYEGCYLVEPKTVTKVEYQRIKAE